MKAYFVRRSGSYDDMVIRAPDEREARNFVSDLDGAELVGLVFALGLELLEQRQS